MSHRWLFLALIAGLMSAARCEVPVLEAVRAQRAPLVDGKLDDPCWAEARAAGEFLINNTTMPTKYPTSAMVMFDDSALHIGVRCTEPDVGSIQTRELPRDHSDVFRTDCIEVMLDPAQTQSEYYHIGVNASGSTADRACTQGGHIGDMSWDGRQKVASHIGEDFWSCEITIPFYCLGISSKVGSTWRINICREKKSPPENSSLAEQGAFNIASRFAELRGIDAKLSPYRYVIGPLQESTVLKGGNLELSLGVPILNSTGKGGKALLDGWLVSPTGEVHTAKQSIEPPVDEEQVFALGPITLSEQGEYSCHVRVADPVTKRTLALRKTPLTIEYVPLSIALLKPWYRGAIFATQNLAEVVFEVDVSLDAKARAKAHLEAKIVRADGTDVLAQSEIADVVQMNRFSFDAKALPEEKMMIQVALKGAGGEVPAKTSRPLRKLAYRPGEVWLGQDMNWHVDGRPFFLNGAWNHEDGFLPEYNAFNVPRDGDVKLIHTSIMSLLSGRAQSLKTDALSEADADMIRKDIREQRDNPKLFAYYVSDEPEVSNTKARVLEQVYELFAEEDPYHPVIISNDSMHGLHAYAKCADINGLHPYPVILNDKPVNDVGSVAAFVEGAEDYFELSDHKQTIAYLHQGFNYGDYGAVNNRIPNYLEYRNQNLLALICGARGFIQFNRMVTHYPELYIGMPHLTREFAYLGEVVLSATPATGGPAADSENVEMLLKEHKRNAFLLACNADMTPRDVTLSVPGIGDRAESLTVVSEDRSVKLDDDSFSDHFGPYEVHVYTTAEDPGLPTVDAIVAEIQAANLARRKPGNLVFQMFEGDGVTFAASSSKSGRFRRPDNGLWHVADGVLDDVDRYDCLSWHDATDNESPDWLEIKLPQAHRISRVVVYPFKQSLRDYSVQAWLNGGWVDISKVSGKQEDCTAHAFEPVTTDRIRLMVTATNGPNAIVNEVEVYE